LIDAFYDPLIAAGAMRGAAERESIAA